MRARRGMLAVVFATAMAACTSTSVSPGPGPNPNPTGTSAATSPGSTTRPRPTGGVTSPPSSVYQDYGSLGTMARTYLRASPARRMVVEVAWVSGREPTQQALDHVRRVLEDVADKPGGVQVIRGRSIAETKGSYTVADIRGLEARHRGRFSGGDTVTMWIVYLDGRYADGEGALGVAYGATSAAVFRDRIDDATTALINARSIERAVITHEVGHLLALINIGYRSERDHEDPEHRAHSRNPESVMYWAVEDVSLRNLLTGGPPDDFDADDRADLEMLKRS